MKVINNSRKDFFMEGGQSMVREHKMPGRHIPPHERKALMNIEFEQSDWELLRKIFGDEDTAFAAAEILREAPPEIFFQEKLIHRVLQMRRQERR